MARQISALFSYIRAPLGTGPLFRVCADFQAAGVRFKHLLAPGSFQLGGKPATSPTRGHIKAALRAEKFSRTAIWKSSQGNCSSSPRGRRGWLGKVALGAALGASAVALVQSLHTGIVTAMDRKVNPNSTEGDWKETKGETVQPSREDCDVTIQCALSQTREKRVCHMTKTTVSHWFWLWDYRRAPQLSQDWNVALKMNDTKTLLSQLSSKSTYIWPERVKWPLAFWFVLSM